MDALVWGWMLVLGAFIFTLKVFGALLLIRLFGKLVEYLVD